MVKYKEILAVLILSGGLLLSACGGGLTSAASGALALEAQDSLEVVPVESNESSEELADAAPTPYPTRPLYQPGELVDYVAQTGDTLPVLALRFNTSVDEILAANSFIPQLATTMPPGMPMKIPIYYLPLWGSPYQILPDSHFVNGPSQVGFDIQGFVAAHPGWMKGFTQYAGGANRSGAEIVEYVALRYSVSPRLLLALLEYQAGALSNPALSQELEDYALGYPQWSHKGVYLQLNWAANLLNNGYYAHRGGRLLSIERPDGRLIRIDPWQNPASAALQYYFNTLYADNLTFDHAIAVDGFAQTYAELFGDPWLNDQPHIPGSLTQPFMTLPFEAGTTWSFTGGSHSPWGKGEPLAALDFAPPDISAGSCERSAEFAAAIADGVVARTETGVVVLDLDGDGDERTGWNIFYLHLDSDRKAKVGQRLAAGDPIGYPSCEGGTSTGTHVHIARKYNGEWMLAEGALAFNLEGWIAFNGGADYEGTLVRDGRVATACVCSNAKSFVTAEER